MCALRLQRETRNIKAAKAPERRGCFSFPREGDAAKLWYPLVHLRILQLRLSHRFYLPERSSVYYTSLRNGATSESQCIWGTVNMYCSAWYMDLRRFVRYRRSFVSLEKCFEYNWMCKGNRWRWWTFNVWCRNVFLFFAFFPSDLKILYFEGYVLLTQFENVFIIH